MGVANYSGGLTMRVLDNRLIDTLSNNPHASNAFPFLQAKKTVEKGCGCGGSQTTSVTTPDYELIRANAAVLTGDHATRFKQHAGVQALKIIYAVNQAVAHATI
jgi:hypothetical protein